MDAREIPYVDEYDVIGAFDVLEHVAEDEQILTEMYRACRPGGGIMITVPQHQFLWSRADDAAQHFRRYSARELRAKVIQAGFRIVRTTSFVTVLLPPLVAARWRKRHQADYSVSTEELAVSPWLNWLLERAIDLDALLIRRGFNFPVGSSLLMVARKD
jgi:SAM-dependent methyltransferase